MERTLGLFLGLVLNAQKATYSRMSTKRGDHWKWTRYALQGLDSIQKGMSSTTTATIPSSIIFSLVEVTVGRTSQSFRRKPESRSPIMPSLP